MTKGKIPIYIDITYDLLGAVFSTLCRNKEIEQAEKLQDIMRQLFMFSQNLKRKNRQQVLADNVRNAINKMGQQAHGGESDG